MKDFLHGASESTLFNEMVHVALTVCMAYSQFLVEIFASKLCWRVSLEADWLGAGEVRV